MMACLNEETLQAYFDGELASEATAKVIRHLAECDGCAASAFEVERAIELMSNAFEDELPDSVPSERLRARIAAALEGDSASVDRVTTTPGFWPQILGAPIAAFRSFALSPRRLAFASMAIVALICAFWFAARSDFFSRRAPQEAIHIPSPTPEKEAPNNIAQGPSEKANPAGFGQSPSPKRHAVVKHDAPIVPLPDTKDGGTELIAESGSDPLRTDSGVFDADMIRHFEKAQILLRSFRNADLSAREFGADLAYERRQSKSLLYKNILLRRDAESSGNVPAEAVLGSLEPVLLDIANLPEQPSSDDVRSIKERIHKREIIAVLQVYSAPSMAASFQP